ncbi:hypothetical protein FQA39_LY07277 [Lamprigera yunnana]|nr:hypothetical protein FQA39_LY07277 [Lamprigera yunnana]
MSSTLHEKHLHAQACEMAFNVYQWIKSQNGNPCTKEIKEKVSRDTGNWRRLIAQKAIYDNAHGDISSPIEYLGNGPNHVCKNYYCGELNRETAAEFNETRASGLFRLVQGALSLVIRKADSFIDNETNNRAELFMSVLARFNAVSNNYEGSPIIDSSLLVLYFSFGDIPLNVIIASTSVFSKISKVNNGRLQDVPIEN